MAEVAEIAGRWLERQMGPFIEQVGIRAASAVVNSIDTAYPPASTAGEPPHKRTGNLAAGVDHQEGQTALEYWSTIASSRVQDDPDVPVYLEFGTFKMAARPYMRPVMAQAWTIIVAAARRSFGGEAIPYESLN